MTKPRILRITRPYESVEDYIEAEGWTISAKRMILLDQPRLDRDTIVRFELSLQGGKKLIRAEARVVGYQTATPDKPGGPKVRFKRFGGTTKAFIQQVVAEHGPGPGLETGHPSSPTSSDSGDPSETPGSLRFTDPAASDNEAPSPMEALTSQALRQGDLNKLIAVNTPSVTLEGTDVVGVELAAGAREKLRELSRRTGVGEVNTPENRNDVLARLRQRAQGSANDSTEAASAS